MRSDCYFSSVTGEIVKCLLQTLANKRGTSFTCLHFAESDTPVATVLIFRKQIINCTCNALTRVSNLFSCRQFTVDHIRWLTHENIKIYLRFPFDKQRH